MRGEVVDERNVDVVEATIASRVVAAPIRASAARLASITSGTHSNTRSAAASAASAASPEA